MVNLKKYNIPLREYDAYISRWMGVSIQNEIRENLLPDTDWKVNLYANDKGFVRKITIDIGGNGKIDEEWIEVDNRICRTTLAENNKFIYTPDSWELNLK